MQTRRTFLLGTAPLAAFLLKPRARGWKAVFKDGAIERPSDAFLESLPRIMEIAGVPGIGMAVVQGGKPVWDWFGGVTDANTRRAADAQSLWPAASLSKPAFAFAALRLVDEKRLDLDRPLKEYVPGHAPPDPRGDKITARHVLSHSSGLRNWRQRADQPLVPDFEPGTRFQYSGEGYYYLLRAVEHITGMGFEQFMDERLFAPLGLRSSTYSWRPDVADRLVTGHDRGQPGPNFAANVAAGLFEIATQAGRAPASFTSEDVAAAMGKLKTPVPALPTNMVPNSAASLLTTPREYATIVAALLANADPRVALQQSTRQLMFTPHTPINSALSWGLGLGQEAHLGGARYAWHWGDNGNWKNFVLIHSASDSAIVVFTNGSRGMNVCNRVMTAATGSEHEAFLWL